MNLLLKLPHDKALHILVGVLLYAGFHFLSPMIGMVVVTTAAISKEIYDYMHRDKHTPDVWDAIATVAGGCVGFICSVRL
jgi:uncharacterized membrane protein